MAFRMEHGLAAKPSDGCRPLRRVGEATRHRTTPRPHEGPDMRDAQGAPMPLNPGPLQRKCAKRPPRPASARPTGLPQPSTRLAPSSLPKSPTRSDSCASSSGTPCDNAIRAGPAPPRRPGAFRPVNQRNDSTSTTASSSQSQASAADPGPDAQYDGDSARVAEAVEMPKSVARPPALYPELDRYRDFRQPEQPVGRHGIDVPFRLATHDLPPPTPGSLVFSGSSSQTSAISASPSTKLSESPYSRDTTPTSLSSQSPVFVLPSRAMIPVRPRQSSPSISRPPVTRRRTDSASSHADPDAGEPRGLAPVRESTTSSSSSSGSTARDGDRSKTKHSRAGLLPPPLSPPPRKSSQKLAKPKDAERAPESSQDADRVTGRAQPSNGHAFSPPLLPLPPRPGPPTRPSRDGTPDIQSHLFEPVPVIQSNLLFANRPAQRRGSEPADALKPLPASTALLPQAKPNASVSHLPTTAVVDGPPPPPPPPLPRPAAPRHGIFHSRFLFFGRKRPSREAAAPEKTEPKGNGRRGPVAGTGHEGYGRVGAVRRRGGSGAAVARPVADVASPQDARISSDALTADCTNPVVMVGREVVDGRNAGGAELARVESEQSATSKRPSTGSDSSVASPPSKVPSRSVLGPSALPRVPRIETHCRPFDNADGLAAKPTLALQPSFQRPRPSPADSMRQPQSLEAYRLDAAASSMTSLDTSVMSDDSHLALQRELSRESGESHLGPPKLTKRARSPRRWNLFSRSPSRSAKGRRGAKVEAEVVAVEKKPVAFYAMMDSWESAPMDVREVLRCANLYPPPVPAYRPETAYTPEPAYASVLLPTEVQTARLAAREPPPGPEQASRDDLADVEVQSTAREQFPALGAAASPGGPQRLIQVGRIPHVLKRAGGLSPRSFSRPLAAAQPRTQPIKPTHDAELVEKAFVPPKPPAPMPVLAKGAALGEASQAGAAAKSLRPLPTELPLEISRGEAEFFAFSPRKNSDVTVSTSSGGSSGSRRRSTFAGATAVIPEPGDPPAEDEVWDEYNDLLGDDRAPRSATSSKGAPFHLEAYRYGLAKDGPPESPVAAPDSRKASTYSRAPTHSTSCSADMTERIQKAFRPHTSPTTAGPGKPEPGRDATGAADAAAETQRQEEEIFSHCSASSSDEESALAQVNLRVGSMTVSKWLTFGHVLFSDIRHELAPVKSSLKRHSMLVIDGLGNDDWSFYAAETYPGASFYNLSPRAPAAADGAHAPAGYPASPPNHHQVQHASPGARFPFAAQSFDCVVYRFPAAGPEAQYRSVVGEARRVLRPGGYIELSILDVDLNNMGGCGRRTVRRLKERIHEQAPRTSLASAADLVVRLLGQAGFTHVKAARVGVPVASSITRRGAGGRAAQAGAPSLEDMMRDDGAVADESITHVVTRVGRWWYSRCYERAAAPEPGRGMWSDKALLSECEALGTSLKLMVCCARAPDRITSV